MTARVISPAPVRKSVRVRANPDRAFDVFARGISRWWPASHSLLKAPVKETVIEPFVNGRWYQIGEDGSRCDNGYVLMWEPPKRLTLAWQLTPDWQFDADLLTEVEVTFTPEADGSTRVDLEHRHLERMGEKADAMRTQIDSPNGWTAIMEYFRESAET